MKILYAKCFGIGNAVMAVPAIKALVAAGHEVDLLIGNLPDDRGSFEIFARLAQFHEGVGLIWVNEAPRGLVYDVAILAIPFDGRWRNGTHFSAARVMDGRPRPDPSTTGLSSWKKHEVEYQMENAVELGYSGPVPSTQFMREFTGPRSRRLVYFGVGYKKDAAGFWKKKHWGNENFAALAGMLVADGYDVVMTGDQMDMQLSIVPIIRMVGSHRVRYVSGNLGPSIDQLSMCDAYVGNDTGMMHVAASLRIPTVAVFNLENSITKSRPWGPARSAALDGLLNDVTPELMLQVLRDTWNA